MKNEKGYNAHSHPFSETKNWRICPDTEPSRSIPTSTDKICVNGKQQVGLHTHRCEQPGDPAHLPLPPKDRPSGRHSLQLNNRGCHRDLGYVGRHKDKLIKKCTSLGRKHFYGTTGQTSFFQTANLNEK